MLRRLSRVFCVFAKIENNAKALKMWSTSIDHRFSDIDRTGTRLPPNDAAHRAESFGATLDLQKSKSRIFGAITGGAAPRRRRRRGAKAGPAGPKKISGGVFPFRKTAKKRPQKCPRRAVGLDAGVCALPKDDFRRIVDPSGPH